MKSTPGVWERSPAGIRIAMGNQGLLDDFRWALPDFTEEDNVGSPYCVRNYVVDPRLGGPEGLATARRELVRAVAVTAATLPGAVWRRDGRPGTVCRPGTLALQFLPTSTTVT